MEHPNHILVVDDDSMTRLLMKTILSRMSYQVSEAFDGIDAWEKVAALSPDLIILDVSMPRMDGLELTHKLKNDPATKNIPIMIVSSHDEVTDRYRAAGSRILCTGIHGAISMRSDGKTVHVQPEIASCGPALRSRII